MPTSSTPAAPLWNAQQLAACQNVNQALVDFGRVAAIALAPLTQTFERTLRDWYQFLQDAYERAGRPYGDTQAGFERWCEEQGEADRKARTGEWKDYSAWRNTQKDRG